MTERLDPKVKAAHKKRDVPWWTHELWETFEETLIREVREETWLKINISEIIPDTLSKIREHEDYIQDTVLYCYICNSDGGMLDTSDPKIWQIQRMNIQEALQLDVLETTMFFLKIYAEHKKK